MVILSKQESPLNPSLGQSIGASTLKTRVSIKSLTRLTHRINLLANGWGTGREYLNCHPLTDIGLPYYSHCLPFHFFRFHCIVEELPHMSVPLFLSIKIFVPYQKGKKKKKKERKKKRKKEKYN
jgi:hypothetical protein